MKYSSGRRRRNSLRLSGHDYSAPGDYFVTICTYQRECLFGEIMGGKVEINALGRVAEDCWCAIPQHFSHARLDEFVVMPNHVHGIIVIEDSDCKIESGSFLKATFGQMMKSGALSTIVRSFKSATAKQINIKRDTKGSPVWQRNYYDHIIRDEVSGERIRRYIQHNPLSWQDDQLNPDNPSKW